MSIQLTEAPTLPLTRTERQGMDQLSIEAYGKRLEWQKKLNRGEKRPEVGTTAAGDPISLKRLHYFTLQEIYDNMVKIIAENKAAAEKARAEAAAKVTTKE